MTRSSRRVVYSGMSLYSSVSFFALNYNVHSPFFMTLVALSP